MECYKDLYDGKLNGLESGTYIAIGTFDGVHKGHQELIRRVVKESKNNYGKSLVITFDPLPKEFFSSEPSIRLTTSSIRAERIASLGVDILLEYTFNDQFSRIRANEFLTNILVPLNPKKIFIGRDFKFGYKGSGELSDLLQAGKRYGFEVELLDFVFSRNQRISSTRIREAIRAGDIELANQLMGKRHEIHGSMVRAIHESKLLFLPYNNVIIPPNGEYMVSLYYRDKEHFTTARIMEGNQPLEVKWSKSFLHDDLHSNVALCFLNSMSMVERGVYIESFI
ncbi:FAD synthetase family protein [Brevibacillus massiliensis]|jgi:riboflavin kinase/FMN adenylyltransferase|uniref:FAD synthetase family protein n=1 Tax=Brevibacillus massiliensis TaxID=1118054 RepID=UPI0002F67405|nr:FAD synthetase family protein [Brevibacillus massiliensis]